MRDLKEMLFTKDTIKSNICCICGKEFEGYGNNPAPVCEEGRCCDDCNFDKVIPARIALLNKEEEEPETSEFEDDAIGVNPYDETASAEDDDFEDELNFEDADEEDYHYQDEEDYQDPELKQAEDKFKQYLAQKEEENRKKQIEVNRFNDKRDLFNMNDKKFKFKEALTPKFVSISTEDEYYSED